MDARQIAALARAGLTDDQIETVVRVTASPKAEAKPADPKPVATHAGKPAEQPTAQLALRAENLAMKPRHIGETVALRMRREAFVALSQAIRSDVVRAGGVSEGTLHDLCRGHRSLLDATCIGMPRTTTRCFAQYLNHISTPTGAVVGGLRWMVGPRVRTGKSHHKLWVVAAV